MSNRIFGIAKGEQTKLTPLELRRQLRFILLYEETFGMRQFGAIYVTSPGRHVMRTVFYCLRIGAGVMVVKRKAINSRFPWRLSSICAAALLRGQVAQASQKKRLVRSRCCRGIRRGASFQDPRTASAYGRPVQIYEWRDEQRFHTDYAVTIIFNSASCL